MPAGKSILYVPFTNAPQNQSKKAGIQNMKTNNNVILGLFGLRSYAIVRKPSILVFKSGLLFGCFLTSFLSSSHRTLTRTTALALSLAFTMTVFRSLTFGSSSIFIWHINHLLSAAGER